MSLSSLPPSVLPRLDRLAAELGLAEFDLLLLGDGSGTAYDAPAGWACFAYDRRRETVELQVGAASCGTINLAELMTYVQALWHHQAHGGAPTAPVRVAVVSDSELTVRCGSGRYRRRANPCFWAAIKWFEDSGYRIQWRHVRRNSNPFGVVTDALAGRARRQMSRLLARHPDKAV